MEINYNLQEISVKIVYYGPGLSGKTTNLEIIHQKTPQSSRGNLTAIATEQDRTLFFDYMPLEIGKIGNFKVRLRLFTVPGQVYYNTTRKLVLRCVDGVVFVADSQEHKIEENVASLNNLRENLLEQGDHLEEMPLLLQFNKRDLPNITPMPEMAQVLNQGGINAPYSPAVAVKGDGVFSCLKEIANMTIMRVESSLKRPKKKKIERKTQTMLAQPPSQLQPDRPSTEEAKGVAEIGEVKGRPKIKLNPLGTPKPKPPGQRIFQPAAPTPPRGTPILRAPRDEEKSVPQEEKSTRPAVQPLGQTIRKSALSVDNLFKGSLIKSGPIKGGGEGNPRTPPGSITPISSPILKEFRAKELPGQKKEEESARDKP